MNARKEIKTMTQKTRHNDEERRQWVSNDEGLYNLYRCGRVSMRKFVRDNRELIDGVIDQVTSGNKPAHYLAY
jgi:hypothetical protein